MAVDVLAVLFLHQIRLTSFTFRCTAVRTCAVRFLPVILAAVFASTLFSCSDRTAVSAAWQAAAVAAGCRRGLRVSRRHKERAQKTRAHLVHATRTTSFGQHSHPATAVLMAWIMLKRSSTLLVLGISLLYGCDGFAVVRPTVARCSRSGAGGAKGGRRTRGWSLRYDHTKDAQVGPGFKSHRPQPFFAQKNDPRVVTWGTVCILL